MVFLPPFPLLLVAHSGISNYGDSALNSPQNYENYGDSAPNCQSCGHALSAMLVKADLVHRNHHGVPKHAMINGWGRPFEDPIGGARAGR